MSAFLAKKMNGKKCEEYRKKGYWGNASLSDCWDVAVLKYTDKIAVRDVQNTTLTFREVDELAGQLAACMRSANIHQGDIVSVQLPGWSEFFVIGVACLKVGAVINPILPNYRNHELIYILNKCKTKMLIIPSCFKKCNYVEMIREIRPSVPALEEVIVVDKGQMMTVSEKHMTTLHELLANQKRRLKSIHVSADDVAAVLFTSGSEGEPKGVLLTHNNIIASERSYAACFNLTAFDLLLMPAPIAHATGFHHAFINGMLTGATCILQDRFDAEACLQLIEKYRCTCMIGATPFVYDLLRVLDAQSYNISSLRFFLCGGSPLHSRVIKKALEAGFEVISVYGSTESVPHAAVGLNAPMEKFIHTDGKAMIGGIEIKVVDQLRHEVPKGIQGEEASRGPNVFVGYLGDDKMTASALDSDGWYYSGDLCVMDSEGYIKITGRKKDIIIRGGENISSSEIEGILLAHPNVHEACVVPMPDLRLGERACAYVVLKDRSRGLTLEQVRCFFDQMRVAKYKYPERIEIVNNLPRSAVCKIQKSALREDIINKMKNEGLLLEDDMEELAIRQHKLSNEC